MQVQSGLAPEVESSRTHFEVVGLGIEASSSRKLPCPRLEGSTIFCTVEILLKNARNLAENFLRSLFVFFNWRSLEKKCLRPFSPEKFFEVFFVWRTLAPVSLALSIPVLDLERVCSRKGYAWPWPRALCPRLHIMHKTQEINLLS